MPDAPARHGRALRLAFPLLRAFAWALFVVLGPWRVVGRYRTPRKGGLVILANHVSDADPIAVQLACPRLVHFMAKSELFEMRVIGPFMRWFKAFPVRRGEPDRGALRHAIALAKAGEAVCLFPEGQLSETGELGLVLPGAALIVRQAGVPVLCCGLRGTERMLPYGKLVPRPAFGWVTATWGEPRQFGPDATTGDILGWVEAQLRSLSGESA